MSEAQNNRDRFPGLGEFVDDLRNVFGAGIKVRYAVNEATDDSVGTPSPLGVVPVLTQTKEAPCQTKNSRSRTKRR